MEEQGFAKISMQQIVRETLALSPKPLQNVPETDKSPDCTQSEDGHISLPSPFDEANRLSRQTERICRRQ
jgi:hypothetical protein